MEKPHISNVRSVSETGSELAYLNIYFLSQIFMILLLLKFFIFKDIIIAMKYFPQLQASFH